MGLLVYGSGDYDLLYGAPAVNLEGHTMAQLIPFCADIPSANYESNSKYHTCCNHHPWPD